MSAASRHVREVAQELFGPDVGCFDGGCIYGRAGSVVTNGGCCCLSGNARLHVRKIQSIALHLAAELELSQAQRRALQETIVKYSHSLHTQVEINAALLKEFPRAGN